LVARCTFDFSLARRRGKVDETVIGSRVDFLLRSEAFEEALDNSDRDKSIVDE
jgi:exonuclease III